MRVESIFISDIQIGERRREEFGDIEGLAESINRFGLFHPIIVDQDSNLIAGERRLRACRDVLKWQEIPCRLYDELTEDERREIELEENVRRKDLTSFEASKQIVRQASVVAPLISSVGDEIKKPNKNPKGAGRKATHAAPKEDIAKSLGISKGALINAEQHVEAVTKYPELGVLIPTQKDTITVAKNLDKLPEQERNEARSKLMRHDQATLAKLAEKPPMPPAKIKPKSAGSRWRDNLSQIRVFISSIKSLGGGEELTAGWTDIERRSFLTELYEFRDDLNGIITEVEEAENGLKQRAG